MKYRRRIRDAHAVCNLGEAEKIASEADAELAALQAKLAEAEAQRAVLVGALALFRKAYIPDGHVAPHDCFATGPNIGPSTEQKIGDYIACPGCRAEAAYNKALANQPPSDLVALVRAVIGLGALVGARAGGSSVVNVKLTERQIYELRTALDTLTTNQPGWRALIESEGA